MALTRVPIVMLSPGQMVVDTFTGDGTTTVFTLSADPVSKNNTWVEIDGVYQAKSQYSYNSATLQITFTVAPPTGTGIEVVSGLASPIASITDLSVTTAKLADGSVTTVKLANQSVTADKRGASEVGEFRHTSSANFTTTAGVWTRAPLVEAVFNTLSGAMDSVTNIGRFTPSRAGYYRVNITAGFAPTPLAAGEQGGVSVYLNGGPIAYGIISPGSGTDVTVATTDIVHCNGTTDYIEPFLYRGTGTNVSGDKAHTRMIIEFLGT